MEKTYNFGKIETRFEMNTMVKKTCQLPIPKHFTLKLLPQMSLYVKRVKAYWKCQGM